jgi:hypothetical protein
MTHPAVRSEASAVVVVNQAAWLPADLAEAPETSVAGRAPRAVLLAERAGLRAARVVQRLA